MAAVLLVRVVKIRDYYLILPQSQPRRCVVIVELYVADQLIVLATLRWKSYFHYFERLITVSHF